MISFLYKKRKREREIKDNIWENKEKGKRINENEDRIREKKVKTLK